MKDYKKVRTFKKNVLRNYKNARNISTGMKISIWFSDVLSVIGLVFFLIGLPFFIGFASLADINSPDFDKSDPHINGEINAVIQTNATENDIYVFEYTYSYNTPDGLELIGTGYSTGKKYNIGDKVNIQYKRSNPEYSTIDGLRSSEFESWVIIFTLIFPLIGIVMMFFSTKKTINAIRILTYGEIAFGKYLNKTPTNTKINNQTVFDLTFEFTTKDNTKYNTHVKTHKYYNLEDDELEKLVYDRDDPENSVFIDVLPKAIRKYFKSQD